MGKFEKGDIMVDSVSNEQAYINAMMAKLPDVKSKEEYSLKKGDNLWALAKKCLNDKNASNEKTANYMLLIAKLNKLDTVEKMNGLKVGQRIYLPNEMQKSKNPTNIRSDAEDTIIKTIDILENDKTLKLEKANMEYGQCYHLYRKKNANDSFKLDRKLVLSFNVNPKGQIDVVSMDDAKKDLYAFGYDYNVDQKGNIKEAKYPHAIKGKLSKEENLALRSKLKELMDNINKK